VLLLGVLELVAMRAGAPHGSLRVTVLDVGQGDALLVDLPDGKLMLIDGGGLVGSPVDTGERAVLPVLRARRRGRIDIAVLSHPHPDHYLGWMTVLERVQVNEIWDSGLTEAERPDGELARLLASLRGRGATVRTSRELCDHPQRRGGATIQVLAPCPSFERRRGANDNSMVLRITFGERTAMLMGDAERDEEAELVAHQRDLHADFLKVGHHGSRTSTSGGLLERVQPSVAAISCGVRNRFGHPHAEPLSRLLEREVSVLRTDRGGAVIWATDGRDVRFENMRPP
jgi:competence protein ComEC